MGNIWCEFAKVFKAPAEALDWLEQKLSGQFDKDGDERESPPCEYERNKTDPTEISIWTLDGCQVDDIYRLEEAICEMQKKFSLTEPWSITWSEMHNEGNFYTSGGHAMVCYKGKATYSLETRRWAWETAERLVQEDSAAEHERT